METIYSLNSNTPATGLSFQAIQSVQSDFEQQEALVKEFTRKVHARTVAFIAESFNDAKDENERAAVIEATGLLGYHGLLSQMF
jgi:hypothetical protein